MSSFINYFSKIFAFFTALSLFFIILISAISLLSNYRKDVPNSSFIFKEGNEKSTNKVAIINLSGPIFNEPLNIFEHKFINSIQAIYVSEIIEDLNRLETENIKGLLISINSPGGSVSATYNLYKALDDFRIKNKIKIYTHTNEILASGGYWVTLASDKIYANYGAIIGSIGVRGPDWLYYDNPLSISSGILGNTVETKNGIKKFNTIAGRSKDLFDPFRMPTKEEVESLQNIVDNIYLDFVNIVSKKRNIENNFVVNNIGALIFDPKSAKDRYLIDGVYNFQQVKKMIIKELNLSNYKIIEKNLKKGLLHDIVESSVIMGLDFDEIIKNRVCKVIDSPTNIIHINNKFMENC